MNRYGRERRIKDKDLFETVEEVFDTKTLLTIYELKNKRIIRRMNGVISAGKESRVYLAYSWSGEPLALKIYLTSTAVFRKGIYRYIAGDPRFNGIKVGNIKKLIYIWARKEYRNLKRMREAGVKVPKPIGVLNNVLVMEFAGVENKRFPLLAEVYSDLDEEELYEIYVKVLGEIDKIVCNAELVHGDLSEFNIMVKPDLDVLIIDVSQAVYIGHPNSHELLLRDIRNVNKFFNERIPSDRIISEDRILERLKPCLPTIGRSSP